MVDVRFQFGLWRRCGLDLGSRMYGAGAGGYRCLAAHKRILGCIWNRLHDGTSYLRR